jgi:TRAP-type mannitol/chloroaromatic compound transport system substrate-binding protein
MAHLGLAASDRVEQPVGGDRAVAEATDGRFQIQVSAAGESIPADGLLDAVGGGKTEMGTWIWKRPSVASATALARLSEAPNRMSRLRA